MKKYFGIAFSLIAVHFFSLSALALDLGPETDQDWILACKKYTKVRYDCASASNYKQCMDIRYGSDMWYVVKDYCEADGTPNWFLMGRKDPKRNGSK